MQEHVKWTTAKEDGDCLDLRIKNKPVLMLEFHLVGGGVLNSANMMEI